MTKQQRGDMEWKQSARNREQHKVIFTDDNQWFVRCANCGYSLNEPYHYSCECCNAEGISDAVRVFFAGKGKKEEETMPKDNCFSNAVARLSQDRPKQYIFTVEVVLKEEDLERAELERGEEEFRAIGAFEVVDVQILGPDDPRLL